MLGNTAESCKPGEISVGYAYPGQAQRTMPDIGIEYHPSPSALEELLRLVDRPGDYCTHGRLFAPLPRLQVAGAGLIPFPVPAAQAQALIAAAERAPYGKGPETVVDRSVRDCWQIDAANVDVGGGAWSDTLAQIVGRAAEGLGCPRERTEARLYKLLVYEPGGFFGAHRDSEKANGMVATLVISLPVAGTGGELVIRHRDREGVIDLRTEDPSELAFAAFYADCVHETRPVVTGHRIVLVYQLVLRGGAGGALERAPDYDAVAGRIATVLQQWDRTTHGAEKLVWLLEYDYSEAGLSFAFPEEHRRGRRPHPDGSGADCGLRPVRGDSPYRGSLRRGVPATPAVRGRT